MAAHFCTVLPPPPVLQSPRFFVCQIRPDTARGRMPCGNGISNQIAAENNKGFHEQKNIISLAGYHDMRITSCYEHDIMCMGTASCHGNE